MGAIYYLRKANKCCVRLVFFCLCYSSYTFFRVIKNVPSLMSFSLYYFMCFNVFVVVFAVCSVRFLFLHLFFLNNCWIDARTKQILAVYHDFGARYHVFYSLVIHDMKNFSAFSLSLQTLQCCCTQHRHTI